MRCYGRVGITAITAMEVLWGVMWGVMGCYEQPAITAITPVMAAPITLSGVNFFLFTFYYSSSLW